MAENFRGTLSVLRISFYHCTYLSVAEPGLSWSAPAFQSRIRIRCNADPDPDPGFASASGVQNRPESFFLNTSLHGQYCYYFFVLFL